MPSSVSNCSQCLSTAEVHVRRGKTDRGIGELEKCLREHDSQIPVRERLASLYVDVGRRDDAIGQMVRVQEAQAESGNIDEALRIGHQIVKLDPHFDNPLSYVAKVNVDRLRADAKKASAESEAKPSHQTAETGRAVEAFKNMPLLADLEPAELATLSRSLTIHRLDEGQILFEQGDSARSLFFVVKGLLEAAADGRKLGLVRSGQCVGEFAFLTGQVRSATIHALARSEMLELSAGSVEGIVRRHPRIKDLLMEAYRERALVNVLAQCPLFEFMETTERRTLAERFEPVQLADREAVFEQGQTGDSLFLIKSGECVVQASWEDREPVELAVLGRNEFFGEVSFLTGVPRTATVTARGECELLRVGEEFLRELTDTYPHLNSVLRQFHIDRMTRTVEALRRIGV